MDLTIDQALVQAIEAHKSGRLQDAERLYRSILQVQPEHAEANHNLGVLAVGVGKPEAALRFLKTALDVNQQKVQFWVSYIDALIRANQLEDAQSLLRRGRQIGLKGDAVDRLAERIQSAAVVSMAEPAPKNNEAPSSGSQKPSGKKSKEKVKKAGQHHIKKTLTQAEIEAVVGAFNMVRYPEAERLALAMTQAFPNHHIGWKVLGAVLKQTGRTEQSLVPTQRSVELSPQDAEAHQNLGITLKDLMRWPEAEASYREAITLKPDYAEAHSNLAAILIELGRFSESEASCRQAIALKPDFAEAHSNLGTALLKLGRVSEAAASCHQAIALKPDFAWAHSNLGNALKDLGRLTESEASYREAIRLKPDFAEAHSNLGNALRALGQLNNAVASYRMALEVKPDFADAYSNMLYLHAFSRDISPELECGVAANWENIVLNESERTAARNRALLFDTFACSPRVGRKLRIGVVSAEIGQHPVAEFLEPFLEQLDRSRFHVTLFPTYTKHDSRAGRLRKLADEFKSLVGMPDDKAADLIRSDRIDILLDTTAHMRGCRLGIFAHRAAPVQCHYIGYHGTTGLTEMDWFIADEVLLPCACDAHFRESIWRLPRLWISYRGDASLPSGRWAPSLDGTVWLGSFNNLAKVREETLALWARVMNAIPGSRLFLKDRQSIGINATERIRMELYRHGISAERVEFAGHVPDWSSHMALYDRLDIALDTIPLNSGTTAFDALWMGVPLVALEGDWMGGRMSSTILKALGRPEWVAQNEDEYIAIVAALAQDVEGRKSLRATQRTLMAGSPLCDAKGLASALEDAFEKMFDLWWQTKSAARSSANNTDNLRNQ